jgi:NAD(P)-dependent dehydrogenase (short-subunit alcohol dehydrogenase family)
VSGVVVLGARNLGGAILDRFLADGWRAAAVAQSADTLEAIRTRGATALEADATDPDALAAALARARDELGSLEVLVNAVSVGRPRPPEPFGGGPLADASLEAFRHWGVATAELAFTFLSVGARALRAGGGGVLVQITNGTARRPEPGSGAWSAGHAALRSLVQTAAEELRGEGIRACALIVDGPIDSPKNAARLAAEQVPPAATLAQDEIADAVAALAAQGPRGLSYELVLTAVGRRWVP